MIGSPLSSALLGALAFATMVPGALAHSYKKKGIEIVHPWIMETSGPDGMISMTIKNSGKVADRLVGATVELADAAKLETPGQVATPTAQGGIVIPARGEAVLSSAGPHVQLAGLKKKLGAYDRLPLVLVFERAGRMEIEVMVEEKQ